MVDFRRESKRLQRVCSEASLSQSTCIPLFDPRTDVACAVAYENPDFEEARSPAPVAHGLKRLEAEASHLRDLPGRQIFELDSSIRLSHGTTSISMRISI